MEVLAKALETLLGVPDAVAPMFLYRRYRLLVCCVNRRMPPREHYEAWLQRGYYLLLVTCERCCASRDEEHYFWYKVDHSRAIELLVLGLKHLHQERSRQHSRECYEGQLYLSADSQYTAQQFGTRWQRSYALQCSKPRRTLAASAALATALENNWPRSLPTTQVDVPHIQASGWSLGDVKRALCDALSAPVQPATPAQRIGTQQQQQTEPATATGAASSEYERLWQERMRRHSPEGVYSERLREIDMQRAQFASTHH
jgi:hypothetical protein